ncbi:PaaI family thioesterase [Sphingomonas montanisoli]|uniref:PaaI family thioesterase n=1 Tax=Sphingomonas montanisoli TaxID=2606412 RepID=A0A5D9C938_9SPHN|nr:PaaI family thioesterase [Sphingomonas montanisoli]TZG27662.1 PaaI family thioesterase [Sphingomonas montanisoli]
MSERQPPYADFLGVQRVPDAGEPRIMMPYADNVQGRVGFVHGGVIGGLLEMACYEALIAQLGDDRPKIKPINVAIDFLRGGVMQDTFAVATIQRIGKRIANAQAIAWQDDRNRPIATARMHFLLDR